MAVRYRLKERVADLEFREKRVVSLSEVAEATGVHRVTLSKIANNKDVDVRVGTIERLCAFFGCPIGALVEFVPERPDGNGEEKPDGHP
jgi:putative transcriptional regulator